MSDPAYKSKVRLKDVTPHLRHALRLAKQAGGHVQIGFLSVHPNGTGQIVCRFDADEFVEDLAAVLDMGPEMDEQRTATTAKELADRIVAAGGTVYPITR